jgi:hypothetical protein
VFKTLLCILALSLTPTLLRSAAPPAPPTTSITTPATVPAGTSFFVEFGWSGNVAADGVFEVTLIEVDDQGKYVRLIHSFSQPTGGFACGLVQWELACDRPGLYALFVIYDPGIVICSISEITAN